MQIARNGALDRRRRDARATPVDDEGMAVIESGGPSPASAPAGFRVEDRTRGFEDPARAVEDAELVALISASRERVPGTATATVSWSSSGGAEVEVNGTGVSSSAASSSESVCIGQPSPNGGCSGGTGSWTIVVYGSDGQVLASETASITV